MVVIIVVSIVLGLYAKDVNSVLQWIVSALYGSYIAANVLKWHWWRFNGYGFFWGMVAGMIPALVFPSLFPTTVALYYFPLMFAISLAGCIIGTLSTPTYRYGNTEKLLQNSAPLGILEACARTGGGRRPQL